MISRGDRLIKESVHSDELKTKILSYRDREKVMDSWLKHRFETVLPKVMKRLRDVYRAQTHDPSVCS